MKIELILNVDLFSSFKLFTLNQLQFLRFKLLPWNQYIYIYIRLKFIYFESIIKYMLSNPKQSQNISDSILFTINE